MCGEERRRRIPMPKFFKVSKRYENVGCRTNLTVPQSKAFAMPTNEGTETSAAHVETYS